MDVWADLHVVVENDGGGEVVGDLRTRCANAQRQVKSRTVYAATRIESHLLIVPTDKMTQRLFPFLVHALRLFLARQWCDITLRMCSYFFFFGSEFTGLPIRTSWPGSTHPVSCSSPCVLFVGA